MKKRTICLTFTLCMMFTIPMLAEQSLNVLFIGNSQMSHYDLPTMLHIMAESASPDRPHIEVGRAIVGGKSLKSHWESGTGEGTPRGMIADGKWDYVVIQDIYAHMGNKPSPQVFEDYATRFDHSVKQAGSKMIVLATASVTEFTINTYRYPDSFKELNDMQIAFAKKMGIPVAAAGYAWMKYLGPSPTLEQRLDLYDKDKGHPGGKGTYIYACLLYAVMTGLNPEGLPYEFKNIRGGISISKDEAVRMQKAAWEQYQENKSQFRQPESPVKPTKESEQISNFKKELAVPGKFTADMEACEKRINTADPSVRQKVVEGMADMMPGLTGDAWRLLVETADGTDAEARQIALRGLIMSVPSDKVTELLNNAEVLTVLKPKIKRLRELFTGRKWQELVAEFKDADLAGWQDKAFAAEALSMRGESYLNLKNGNEAETDLKNAIGLSPSNANIWFRLAENYRQNLNDNQKALEAYIKVNEMTKGSLGWMECSAVLKATAILRELGRNEEVLKILETADREKESPYRTQKYSAYVDALTALDRKEEAISECNKFLQLKISAAEKSEIEKKLKVLQGAASQPPIK